MVFGNVVAIAQTQPQAHAGVFGHRATWASSCSASSPAPTAGYEAALYYTIAYVIMTLGSFGVIVLASRAGFEADELDHFKGLHKRDPLLALRHDDADVLAPPACRRSSASGRSSHLPALWLTGHYWLASSPSLISVIGAFYYLRVVKLMYFDEPGRLPSASRRAAAARGARRSTAWRCWRSASCPTPLH